MAPKVLQEQIKLYRTDKVYRRSDPEGLRGSNPLSSCLLEPITRQFRPVRSLSLSPSGTG